MAKKPKVSAGHFDLNRALHLTADGKVVEEDDPAGVSTLGGKGLRLSPEDVAKYGLDDSYRLLPEGEPEAKDELVAEETPIEVEAPAVVEEAVPIDEPAEEEAKPKKKPLPKK